MSAKINKHFFHGLYSNGRFGYSPPSLPLNKLWADYPIHFKRAIFGATDPNSSTGGSGGPNEKPSEFEDEESAFEWYKKSKYGLNQFNLLNFPEDFCKNYFLISEGEFHNYTNYFNGMLKSILFKWKHDIEYQGSHEDLDDCECPESDNDFYYGSGSDLIGANVLLTESFEHFISQALENGDDKDDCCYCPPCEIPEEDRSDYKCSSNFKANFSLDVEIDTEKIFEISNLEKRFGADKITRRFTPSYKDDPENEDEDLLYSKGVQLYKNNWELDPGWNKVFRSKNFSENATRINDPVILKNFSTFTPNFYLDFITSFNTNNLKQGTVKEIIDNQNQLKESNNLGYIKHKIDSENAYFTHININFFIEFSTVCYIKSQNKFMCFVEIDSATNDGKNHYINRSRKEPDDYSQLFPIFDSNISPLTIFSTSDLYKIKQKDENHFICPNSDETGLKLKKDKLNIKIDDQNVEIEVYTPERTEVSYKSWKTGVSFTGCENKDLERNCSTDAYTKKWIINKPTIELRSWKNDFVEQNIFPPKVGEN
jgi:hypothetical protein